MDTLSDKSPQPPVLALDTSSFVPYYEQIAEQVRRLIRESNLKPGQTFYSEAVLAEQLGVSKMPVRHAFQKLRSEGFLLTKRGKVPVIGSGPVPWNFKELHGFSEEMRRRGLVPSTKLLSFDVEYPSLEVAKALRIPFSEQVYRMKRLRFADGEPVALTTSYVPKQIFQDFEKHDLEGMSLYYIFEHLYGRKLLRSEQIIAAINAGHEEAQLLQTAVGDALLFIKETAFDARETAVEYGISLLRGDRHAASVVSVRQVAPARRE
ncbi:MAG: GntR family transcriptional regulator [Terriglobales bacterium]